MLFPSNTHEFRAAAIVNPNARMEPDTPIDIDDPPFSELPYPAKVLEVKDVLKTGKSIPLKFAYNDKSWKRQAYKSYWHSSDWRWSYVPNRIHFAMHRMFVTYPTAARYFDFAYDVGIAEESDNFNIPNGGNPYEYIVLVVMQTDVEKIVTSGNQVVVVGKPALTGLQVLLIPTKELQPFNDKDSILFQLATKDGDVFDYDTIEYLTKPPVSRK